MNSNEEQAQIRWYDHKFYTNQPMPPMPEELTIEAYPEELQGYYFVQFEGPVSRDMKEGVVEAGGELLEYVPRNTYIVRMDEAARTRIQTLPFVQWVGIYQPAMRLSGRLLSRLSGEELEVPKPPARLVLKKSEQVTEEPSPPVWTVQVFRGEDLQAIQQTIVGAGGEILATEEGRRRHLLRVRIAVEGVYELARINGVMRITEYIPPELCNDAARGVMSVAPVWETHGLRGSNQIVGIADTGLDTGFDDYSMHADLRGRIVDIVPWASTVADEHGHGTHVAGSAVGDGTASGGKYSGAAPGASLVFQAVGSALEGLPLNLYDLFEQAYNAGARIHSNSWGIPFPGGNYEVDAYAVDEFVWDYPDMLILFAAGNSGEDSDQDNTINLGSTWEPSTAKSALAVGASENNHPEIMHNYKGLFCSPWGDCPLGPEIAQDLTADNPSGMAAFSSRGPTNDRRIKPDVVAPGTMVASLRSQVLPPYFTHIKDEDLKDWTADAPWERVPGSAHCGDLYWHYNSDGNNNTEEGKGLTSPELDLSLGGLKTLKFWCSYDLPADGDLCFVEFSVDGENFTPHASFSGVQCGWEMWRVHLWDFSNSRTLRVRFRVIEDENNKTKRSVSVDDVRILEGDRGHGQPSDDGLEQLNSKEDRYYFFWSGTSMATPLTAGAAALVREYYANKGIQPSAALLRATLINGAREMYPGQYGPDVEMSEKPNNHEGWGRVDVQNSLFPPEPARLDWVDDPHGLDHGESREFYISVADDSVPVIVTMVYHDYPGFGLWNQLHLTVTPRRGGGDPIHPNGMDGPDVDNNVQQVVIQEPEVGYYLIRVEGASVQEGPQPFALVTSAGGKIEPLPPPNLSIRPRELLDFGDVAVNYLSREEIRVYNAGGQALDVKLVDVETDEEFFIRMPGGETDMTLAPKEKKRIHVRFLPSEVGLYRGELTFESNDLEKPQVEIDLQGRGMPWLWAQQTGEPWGWPRPQELTGYINLNEWGTLTADIWNIANVPLPPSDWGESAPPLLREKPRIWGDLFPSEPERTFAFLIDQVSVDVQEAQAEFKAVTTPEVPFLLKPRERFGLKVDARPTELGWQNASVEILCVWKPEGYTPWPWLPDLRPWEDEEVTWLFKLPVKVKGE